MAYSLTTIGTVKNDGINAFLQLHPEYIPGLKALEGFSHIDVLWWFDGCDNNADRHALQMRRPYKNAPNTMGVFATRSPARPNPIALTVCEIISIDFASGTIRVAFMDANDNSPILDVKPYTPSFDRVENPGVPAWCCKWPNSTEASGRFDWEQVFNF